MNHKDDISDIVKAKKFVTIWHCLEYLLLANYSVLDAMAIAMREYGSEKIFSRVAFVRAVEDTHSFSPSKKYKLVVGLIDEKNIHLHGVYRTYRKWLATQKPLLDECVEKTCEVIIIDNITPFLFDYFDSESLDYFGNKIHVYKSLDVPPYTPSIPFPDLPTDEDRRKVNDDIIKKILAVSEEVKRKRDSDGSFETNR